MLVTEFVTETRLLNLVNTAIIRAFCPWRTGNR